MKTEEFNKQLIEELILRFDKNDYLIVLAASIWPEEWGWCVEEYELEDLYSKPYQYILDNLTAWAESVATGIAHGEIDWFTNCIESLDMFCDAYRIYYKAKRQMLNTIESDDWQWKNRHN